MLDRYRTVREQTLGLIIGLSAEDCCAQSMAEASPAKWHLAHTTWFFETFVLEMYTQDFKPFNPLFRMLFNSYYESVGPKFSRPARGLMTRPSLQEVIDYRESVDLRMSHLLTSFSIEEEDLRTRIEWGLQHEQQHQELILSDLKHLFFQNPLRPALSPPFSGQKPSPQSVEVTDWFEHPGGMVEVGGNQHDFCFDNELPGILTGSNLSNFLPN